MIWWTLLIALGLAMDALAVAIATGLTLAQVTPRHVFRLAFHFGLFQAMMPIIGWLAGRGLESYIQGYDHWLAFVLLSYVGGKMIWESCRSTGEPARQDRDPTRGIMLVTLSVATSVDALAVGVTMALIGISVWVPSLVIGLVAGVLTAFGIVFGRRLGSRWGHWAELAGGLVLLGIGVKILWSHLAGPASSVVLWMVQ